MKLFFSSMMLLLLLSSGTCNKDKTIINNQCYKGRLEIKAICGNYTITLLEGNLDASKMEASWTDENTHKTYTNVFALGSPCSFPDAIKEGQEFYFTLDDAVQNCVVCQAYYPKPS